MKTILVVAVVVFVALAAWYASIHETTFLAREPSSKTAPLPALSAQNSTVTLPVEIPIDLLEKLANLSFDTTFAGSQRTGDLRLNWSAKRSPIVIEGSGGSITMSATIAGSVTAIAASVPARVFGAIAGLLTCLNPGLKLGKVNLTASVVANMGPRISVDWHLGPSQLGAKADVNEARLRILCWPSTSVRSEVRRELDKWIQKGIRQLRKRLAQDRSIREVSQRAWKKICRSFPLDRGSWWLESKPISATTAQPIVANDSVRLQVGVVVQGRVISRRSTPNCPFPRKLLVKPPQKGRFRFALSGKLDYSKIGSRLRSQVVGKTTKGSIRLKVRDLQLRSYGRSLLLETALTARTEGWLGLRARGTIYVIAEPKLDGEKQILAFDRIRLDVESKDILTEVVGEAAEPLLLALLRTNSKVDLGKLVEQQLLPKANNAFRALSSESIEVEGGVRRIELTHLVVGPHSLQVAASAEGVASLAVQKFSIPRR